MTPLPCLQRIPIWWRWYYWGNPLAWTIYGMVASQFGDFDDELTSGETVKEYLRRTNKDDMMSFLFVVKN
ncbi:hypothetical protein LXL04_032103 [Taraxacum kok-saghyz]